MASSSSSSNTSSVSSVVTSLVFNLAIFFIFVIAFLLLRPKNKSVYQKRVVADTVPENERPRPLKEGIFGWFTDLVSRSDSEVIRDAGLDGYFFLRYLRLLFLCSLVGVVLLYPILLAVNATGGGSRSGATINGFDILSFANIKNPNRYYAHVFLSWLFFGFIMFTLYRELQYYVAVRQSVLTSPAYSNRVSRRTVLISTIPDEYLSAEALKQLFQGVKYVTINRNQKKLSKVVEKRDKLANKVEGAGVKYLKTAVKNRLKSEKKGKPIEGENIADYVPDKKRPTYRLKPLIGKKVDTLDYGSREISKLNAEIADKQTVAESSKTLNSAFVTFYTQEQAEIVYQCLNNHLPLHMEPKAIGILPDEIIWSNLRFRWWELIVRSLGAKVAIGAVVIFWSIPVAFVGFLSNLDNLQKMLPFLKFLNNLPSVLHGLFTSLLPTILLAVLMMLLPIFIRKMAVVAGKTSKTQVEYFTQNAYFAFQVVQVFLVTTLASGAASVITSISDDPSSAMTLLANKIPAASNFYIAYFLLQGFSVSSGMFLQVVALILFYVLGAILDSTPRKKWSRYNIIGGAGWGTIFPIYANLFVITLCYAMVAPILLVFAAITYGLIYLAFLNNLSFCQSPTNGGGIFYCRAIYQTFTGLYLAEICLLGLFVMAKSWGPIVLEAILIGFTVFFQVNLQSAFGPLQDRLPISLMSENEMSLQQRTRSNFSDDKTAPSPSAVEAGHKHFNPLPTGGALVRYFAPHKFLTPECIQRDLLTASMFHEPPAPLSPEDEENAYKNPAVTSTNPVVWLPRDPWGLSTQEVSKLRDHDVNATDEGAWFEINQKKKKATYGWGDIQEIPVWSPPAAY